MNGLSSCSTMLDLSKCYERAEHSDIARAAVFPLRLLAITLAVYSGDRRITLERAASGPVAIVRAIPAGDPFATFLLRAVLMLAIEPLVHDPRLAP
jgi:hypothetical protein